MAITRFVFSVFFLYWIGIGCAPPPFLFFFSETDVGTAVNLRLGKVQ